MEDRGDAIKQMIINQPNPSVIALGDELNVSDILGERCEENSGTDKHAPATIDNQSDTRKKLEIKCSICGKCFPSRRYLNRHFSKHTGRYSCRTCRKAFARKETLLKHLPRCKAIRSHSPSRNKKRGASKVKNYVCEICPKTFSRRENYDQHFLIHLEMRIKCLICRKSLSSFKSYRRHLQIHERTPVQFPCPYCPSTFSNKANLKRHYRLFQHQKGGICSNCKQHIKTIKVLRKHQNQIPIKCNLCSALFCLEIDLKNHLKANHPTLWFKCKECSISTPFMTRGECHLKEHVKKRHKRVLGTNDCYTEGWYILFNE